MLSIPFLTIVCAVDKLERGLPEGPHRQQHREHVDQGKFFPNLVPDVFFSWRIAPVLFFVRRHRYSFCDDGMIPRAMMIHAMMIFGLVVAWMYVILGRMMCLYFASNLDFRSISISGGDCLWHCAVFAIDMRLMGARSGLRLVHDSSKGSLRQGFRLVDSWDSWF